MRTARMIFLAIALAASICITGGMVHAGTVAEEKGVQDKTPPAFAPDQVIVAFKPGTPGEAKRAAHTQAGGHLIHTLDAIGAHVVGVPSGTVLEKIAVYKHNPNVRYAEPNYYRTLAAAPVEGEDDFVCSDYYWDEQWGLHNTGQTMIDPSQGAVGACTITGATDADIDWLGAYEAGWTGSSTIKIAIVDAGVECSHPDFNIIDGTKCLETWVAPGITEGSGDLTGHGTHAAGIAAAYTNNGVGIAGVGGDAQFGSLKACTFGQCLDSHTAAAITYAASQDYDVIHMGFVGPHSTTLQSAVSYALTNTEAVLVAPAGNEYKYQELVYPAAYEGVIAVAATDYYDNLADFSNFGQWVEMAAPGVNILSTYPAVYCWPYADCYNWASGTSTASAMVAGAAALLKDKIAADDPPATRNKVINALLNNADHTGALGQNMLAWTQYGRLNLYSVLTVGGPSCGDATCDTGEGENPCNCPDDCGTPPTEVCTDGVNNDCDTLTDCDDPDCTGDPACPGCGNTLCEAGEDCNTCPNDCDGKQTGKPSSRFCCGNGVPEDAEGDATICDGNY